MLDKHEKREREAKSQTEEKLTFAERALREYEKGDPRKQRDVVTDLSSKLTLNDKILNIQAEEPFKILVEATNCLPEILPTFETANQTINKGRTRSLDQVRPMWLPN